MASSKSMAVWCTQSSGAKATSFEVHFNYWRLAKNITAKARSSTDETCDFAEIGVRLDDAKSIDQIFIYIPLVVNVGAIEDCSSHFRKTNIAQGIFNEVIQISRPNIAGARSVVLREKGGKLFCRVHCFKMKGDGHILDNSELSVTKFAEGCLIIVKSAALATARTQGRNSKVKPVYFRLRVPMPPSDKNNPFATVIQAPDRLLQSGSDQIEYLDFRLNEARTLPTEVETRMRDEHAVGAKLKLVAFLTAIPVECDLSEANTQSHKMRLLEYPIWKDYAPGVLESMVVYHWKKADPQKHISDFNAFVKLRVRRSNAGIIIKYLGFAFLFGILGNLAASGLQAMWPKVVNGLSCLCR